MKKNSRFHRSAFFNLKRRQQIISTLIGLIFCLIIMNFFSSSFIYNNSPDNFQNDEFHNKFCPKISGIPNISVYLPTNYSLHGKIASNYSINISGGPGNYTWYEFLKTGEKSTPIELNGLLNEDVNGTFDQDL